jgi:hypothetical protein
VARTNGVADAGHKVGYWIGQTHSLSSNLTYQLDLTTPGISPRSAN